ncbi:MAG: DUF3048 domain-containing protein [Streptococcaceae bacterium]|nr:DUF3048 domain-containing protein [Streptococcaceae bacterium]
MKKPIVITIISLLAAGALALGVLFALGNQPKKKNFTTSESSVEKKEPPKPVFNPLTGIQEKSNEIPKHIAIGVKQENADYEGVRQFGLEKADVVYEYPLESAWDSRFLAVYYTNVPEKVGPVRSYRKVDKAIMEPYKNAMIMYSGHNGPYAGQAKSAGLIMNETGNSWRNNESGFQAPHNLWVKPEEALKEVEKSKRDLPPVSQFLYSEDEKTIDKAGLPFKGISFSMAEMQTNVSWKWENNQFVYYKNDSPMLLSNEKKYAFDKVIVIHATFQELPEHDMAGTPASDIQIEGEREGYLFAHGKYLKIKVKKENDGAIPKYYTEDGKEIVMSEGRTFVQFVIDKYWPPKLTTDEKQ